MQNSSSSIVAEKRPVSRRAVACLAVYWLVLCLATHWRNPWPRGGTPSYPDKLVHFTAYGILAALAVHALGNRLSGRGLAMRAAAILAIVIGYGLLDEFTQPLTGRDFEWLDWAADIGGAACGALLVLLGRLCWKNRQVE